MQAILGRAVSAVLATGLASPQPQPAVPGWVHSSNAQKIASLPPAAWDARVSGETGVVAVSLGADGAPPVPVAIDRGIDRGPPHGIENQAQMPAQNSLTPEGDGIPASERAGSKG